MTNLFLVQHSDFNVSPARYRNLEKNQLLVTNLFYTIQGEGPFAGTPAVFLRLAGCNRGDKQSMGCQFCDTRFEFNLGKALDFSVIRARMIRLLPEGLVPSVHPLLVITGGEPMLQDNLAGFVDYVVPEWYVQIESNGDRLARGFDEPSSKAEDGLITLVVSPKINKDRYLIKPAVLERANYLKFLIDSRIESPYFQVPKMAGAKNPDQVYLSPITVYHRQVREGEVANMWDQTLIDHEATAANYERAAGLAMAHGFLVSIQKHLLFGVE